MLNYDYFISNSIHCMIEKIRWVGRVRYVDTLLAKVSRPRVSR